MARSNTFAQVSLPRLGENNITAPWFLLEL